MLFLKRHKNTNVWSRGGLQHNGFLTTIVLQNVKSYRFFVWHFFRNLVDVQNIVKYDTIALFLKAKKGKKHFEGLLSGPSRGYYLVQGWVRFKNVNLDQIITPEMFARRFCFQKDLLKRLLLLCFLTNSVRKANLDQIITHQKAKLGPDNNSTAKICMYIYIIDSKLGLKLAFFESKLGPSFQVSYFSFLFCFQKSSSFCRENELFQKRR